MRLREIAELLGGEVLGDPETEITGVAGVEDAGPGDITFATAGKHASLVRASGASCVMVRERFPDIETAQLRVADPYYAFAVLLGRFYAEPRKPGGISPLAFVSESASLGRDVAVGAFAFVSDRASIGDGSSIGPGAFIGEGSSMGGDCLIYPSVVVRENVVLGDRVIIHPGSVIGSDGFGYVQKDGRHHKIPQVGVVRIGNDVEIGANVTIDRATTGATVIGDGTKIDNLVQIAHNVTVGRNAIIVAQAGIAGSTEIGDGVMIGGQVGVADHSKLAPGTMIGAQSGVMGEVPRGVYSGSPAIAHRDWLRASSVFAKLPELQRRMKALEEKLEETERRRGDR